MSGGITDAELVGKSWVVREKEGLYKGRFLEIKIIAFSPTKAFIKIGWQSGETTVEDYNEFFEKFEIKEEMP